MFNYLNPLTPKDVENIHSLTLDILENVGVEFHYAPAIEVFQRAGCKTDGWKVYIPENVVEKALGDAPAAFTVYARNPARNVQIGGDDIIFIPAYGAPFVADRESGRRKAKISDYVNLVKLAYLSQNMDLTGGVLVEPNDIPDEIRHLQMLYACIKCSDKVFMGSSAGSEKAKDTLEVARILHGTEFIRKNPVMLTLINSLTPLIYDDRMLGAMMEYAKNAQPVIVASLGMAGSTSPATLAATLTMQNVEVLAGITLCQLINPATPVVYGAASSITEMRYGSLTIGAPEAALIIAASAQLARHYKLPCRGGGALTDSKLPDAQAGLESMMHLLNAVYSGVNVVLHAAGILEYYMTFSYEKFLIDDEICSMVRRIKKGMQIEPDTLGKDVIYEVGPGSHFLDKMHTYNWFKKEFWDPRLCDRGTFDHFNNAGGLDMYARAAQLVKDRLEEYVEPGLDKDIERQLLDKLSK
ncbi:MAG: trimethylamine methyltransferase family protein [Bacillota bacterium]